MTPSERLELEACINRASEILYNNVEEESLKTLEDIEITVREQVLENVSPQITLFLLKEKQKREKEESEK
ncbi:hypothetical protein CY0110_02479 [Crocosphaera chwakensis CCY0110]|uniref:Uncharacterized protein n=1 Tax=Crocosphaera chwakensis CCY0110 TaxID=391612 RepID=A3IM99_9CHRO|nr:hypothetical protein CY0110_02479 [Crocosphaera chwakensis CCY0110]